MLDPFLLFTPLLVLAILALVRFIGCDKLFDIDELPEPPDPPLAPTNLRVQYGNQTVTLTWDPSPGATGYQVKYRSNETDPFSDGSGVSGNKTIEVLPYSVTRRYVVVALKDSQVSTQSNEVTATGARELLATITRFGTRQSFFNGLLGMKVTTTTRLKIVALGRVKYLNVQPNPVPIVHSHEVKLMLPGTPLATEVSGATVTISLQSGVQTEHFLYETLTTDVFFEPATTFYVVSQETERTMTNPDADEWHDFDTTAISQPEATLDEGVYQPDATPGVLTESTGGPNHLYVPVSALYHPAPLPQP